MFDLRRNLLTTLLAAGIGVLAITAGVLALSMGRPDVAAIEPRGDTRADEVEVDVPETGLKDFSEYSAIIERPVFFSDRRLPVVEAPGDPEEALVEEEEAEEIGDLEAAVAGIVITPEMKLAMVSDEQAGKTLVMREGMSLEGDQAAWRLESIQARQVSFVSVDGRQTDLELQVNTRGIQAPAPASRPAEAQEEAQQAPDQAPAQAAQQQASDEARARAEEIRRRVAERRAQLRAEAERRARQREQKQDNNG